MGTTGPDTHSIAHRYAIFLCSLDVDDNLVVQQTQTMDYGKVKLASTRTGNLNLNLYREPELKLYREPYPHLASVEIVSLRTTSAVPAFEKNIEIYIGTVHDDL